MEGNGFVPTSKIGAMVRDGSSGSKIKVEPVTSSLNMIRREDGDGIASGEKFVKDMTPPSFKNLSNK